MTKKKAWFNTDAVLVRLDKVYDLEEFAAQCLAKPNVVTQYVQLSPNYWNPSQH